MDYFKDFTYKLRKYAYTSEVIIYLRRVGPKLLQIVTLLQEVKFENGSYHTYYGEVKRIMSGFLVFYYVVMDDIAKDADRLGNLATKEDLVELVEKTIEYHKANLEDFLTDYIPENATEQDNAREVQELYNVFIEKVFELRVTVQNLTSAGAARDFARENYTKCIHVAKGLCEFAYTYLAVMLADNLDKTRFSLIEIHNRIKNNLKKMEEESEEELHTMFEELYNLNKESATAIRAEVRSSDAIAVNDPSKAGRAIENMQMKIEHFDSYASVTKIKEEVAFWGKKLEDFNKVADNLNSLKAAMELQSCCGDLRVVPVLKQKWEEEARTLLTFYACRGIDNIIYTDNIGNFYLDEYNHQVYVVDHGLTDYHFSCTNKFSTPPEKEYFFDKHGRYVYQAGKKAYQLAPCGSLYKLGRDDVLHKAKTAAEAGLTEEEFINMQCRRKIKDPTDITIVPDFEPINIANTMDKDNATYLWDTFGSILPHALHDVALAKSKNPIHYLAHRLLYHRYNVSKKELRDRKIAADEFKANVYKKRKEKVLSASKSWKSKQVKRRKPEESDDSQERAVYDAHIAREEFINSLNYFYD